MRYSHAFEVPLPAAEAWRRAEQYLLHIGYRALTETGVYQRQAYGSPLMALSPLAKKSMMRLSVRPCELGARVEVQQRVVHQSDLWTQADIEFFRDEIDDLKRWVASQSAPEFDRKAQAAAARMTHIKGSFLLGVPGIALWLGLRPLIPPSPIHDVKDMGVLLLAILLAYAFLPLLPLRAKRIPASASEQGPLRAADSSPSGDPVEA